MIEGAGAGSTIIDASGIDRAFHVLTGVTAVFRNLSIRGGVARDDGQFGSNATERDSIGGAILSIGGNVDLTGVEFSNNTAFGTNNSSGDGYRGIGGAVAIYSASLFVTDSSFTNNLARAGDGATGASGSGIGVGIAGFSAGSSSGL